METPQYTVFLFPSVSHTPKAEKILIAAGIAHKLIPVPRHISMDCGVCLLITADQQDAISKAFREKDVWEGMTLL